LSSSTVGTMAFLILQIIGVPFPGFAVAGF
jgi:hypothetical protein